MSKQFIYINLDGFGRYYYDMMEDKQNQIPHITQLMHDGVFFEDAVTGIPSITYPMQCAIVSGGYSDATGNCYQYLDWDKREIVLQRRYNRAQTIGELLKEQGVAFVSIQQFTLEDRGAAYGSRDSLYIQPRGDAAVRLGLLEKLIRTNSIEFQGVRYDYERLPPVLFLYADDLDSIGHNPDYFSAYNETERCRNVLNHIRYIDQGIGRVVQALKARGLYEDTTLLLTTDHGMISYTGPSKIGELEQALRGQGYARVCSANPGPLPDGGFDAVLTSHDIQCQIYFKEEAPLEALKDQLLQLPFVESVMARAELTAQGVSPLYADLLVSPVEGCHFGIDKSGLDKLKATHDSLHPKCRRIFSLLSGAGVKKGMHYPERVQNIDFMPTFCRLWRLPPLRNATGRVLEEILSAPDEAL